jgi:hypothetical protein
MAPARMWVLEIGTQFREYSRLRHETETTICIIFRIVLRLVVTRIAGGDLTVVFGSGQQPCSLVMKAWYPPIISLGKLVPLGW